MIWEVCTYVLRYIGIMKGYVEQWYGYYDNGDTVDAILAGVQRVLVRTYARMYVVRRQ